MYDETAHEAMRTFRKHFVTVHYYGFYVLRRPVELATVLGRLGSGYGSKIFDPFLSFRQDL